MTCTIKNDVFYFGSFKKVKIDQCSDEPSQLRNGRNFHLSCLKFRLPSSSQRCSTHRVFPGPGYASNQFVEYNATIFNRLVTFNNKSIIWKRPPYFTPTWTIFQVSKCLSLQVSSLDRRPKQPKKFEFNSSGSSMRRHHSFPSFSCFLSFISSFYSLRPD